eukprot:TRINITY_DN17572_c0_g2_i2.p1 TRINITY_DN17572_c0_g2~~TRINITY_DN17572_c0_g2_i2.p1  ORF type:complete len:159 (+),score=47.49 TRINITY_DN17572_c0_g2_i2:73-549(+)
MCIRDRNDHRDIEMEVGDEEGQVSSEAAELVNTLLERDPEKRLASALRIREFGFFKAVDWETLRQQEAPFVPETVSPTDTSYFAEGKMFKADDYFEYIPNKPGMRKNLNMPDFDFRTLNVKSLAKKNKEDALITIRKLRRESAQPKIMTPIVTNTLLK